MAKNWTMLPDDVLGEIFKRSGISNIFSLKMTCKAWYSIMQKDETNNLSIKYPIRSPPWLAIYSPESIPDNSPPWTASYVDLSCDRFLFDNGWRFPSANEAICIGSCGGWLAFIDTRCVVYLKKPFNSIQSSSSYVELPPIHTLPCIVSSSPDLSSSLGLVDFVLYEFPDETYTKKSNELYKHFIWKLVLSEKDGIVMMMYGKRNLLAACKMGDNSWKNLNGKLECNNDILYSKDRKEFCVLSDTGSVEIWNFIDFSCPKSILFDLSVWSREPSMLNTEEPISIIMLEDMVYLAESYTEGLLAVVRYHASFATHDGRNFGEIVDDIELEEHVRRMVLRNGDRNHFDTFCFDVYKIYWEKKEWVHTNTLYEDALFVGINNAMYFSSWEFPWLYGNMIYFTNGFMYYNEGFILDGHDLGMFDMEKNDLYSCYYPIGYETNSPPPVWFLPYSW